MALKRIFIKQQVEEGAGIVLKGHQEAITFYHRNGSGIDLSGISNPLVTNITAQSVVGLSPAAKRFTLVLRLYKERSAAAVPFDRTVLEQCVAPFVVKPVCLHNYNN
ncbi:hypothetical protein RR48_15461 [Papilio machaon]|uniref:Uncharacterized protein n=1 Tax=Papilio machaon TaxID=76193 RepID=A0A194QWI0_PAPMA|nr:hypothetical protein RR48_15461 [Papilio machaon]